MFYIVARGKNEILPCSERAVKSAMYFSELTRQWRPSPSNGVVIVLERFLDHPASVGESYGQHLGTAWRFAFALLGAGLAALVHGLLPFAFEHTASGTVQRLNARMLARRASGARAFPVQVGPLEPDKKALSSYI